MFEPQVVLLRPESAGSRVHDSPLIGSQPLHQLSPEAGLALALARHNPSERHIAYVRRLVEAGIDWPRLHRLAVRNNVVPLLSSNLERARVPGVPGEAIAMLVRDRERIRLRAMLLLSWQLSLINKTLIPRGIRFALVKGVGFSQRYYGDPISRHSQDIDMLVEAGRLAEVAGALIDDGWTVANPAWSGHPLRVFARYSSVIEMRSPEGVRIELHKTLDNSGLVFDSSRLLERVTELTVMGKKLPALAPVDEFLYACFHHSRHGWSCLHWCADLPAMMAVPEFDTKVLPSANMHTLMKSTLSACLLLADNLDKLGAGANLSELPLHSPFLVGCLRSVDREEPPPPMALDPSLIEPDFPESWQRSGAYRIRFALSRFRPNLNDYNALPLVEGYTWIYWLTRPWRSLARRLGLRPRIANEAS